MYIRYYAFGTALMFINCILWYWTFLYYWAHFMDFIWALKSEIEQPSMIKRPLWTGVDNCIILNQENDTIRSNTSSLWEVRLLTDFIQLSKGMGYAIFGYRHQLAKLYSGLGLACLDCVSDIAYQQLLRKRSMSAGMLHQCVTKEIIF